MSDASGSLKKASDSLDSCVERCRGVSAQHSGMATIHDDLRSLHAQIPDTNLRAQLAAKMAAATQAHKNVADGHDQLARGLEAAQLAVRGAQDSVENAYHEPTGDLSKGGGTFDSAGLTDGALHDFSPEAVRARDLRRGIEHCYEIRRRLRGVWP